MSAHHRRWEWAVLGALFTLWFAFFAPVFDPFLNADHAIHVMMAAHFSFDDSLYFWGQDRLGSLLPLLTQPIATLIHPLWATSIVQFILLIATWYFWSRFLHRGWMRVLLAFLLLFPPVYFGALVDIAQPYTPQMMLWGAAFYFYRRNPNSALILFGAFLLLMISVWVSETSWGALIVFVGWVIYRELNRVNQPVNNRAVQFFKQRLLPMVAAIIPGLMLVLAAKKNSTRIPGFSDQIFNTPGELITLIREILFNTINYLRAFTVNSPFQWPGFVLFAISFFGLIFLPLGGYNFKKEQKFLLLFFWCLLVVQLTGILAAHWTLLIDHRSRLFSHGYFLMVFVLLFFADQFPRPGWRRLIATGLLVAGISLGGWHLYHTADQMAQGGSKSTLAQDARDFPFQLNTTYIGNYWYVYLLGAYQPVNVNYLPHEGDYVRYAAFRDRAFEADRIVLIANDWLKEFPDQVVQYGAILKKSGTPQTHGHYKYCTYKLSGRAG